MKLSPGTTLALAAVFAANIGLSGCGPRPDVEEANMAPTTEPVTAKVLQKITPSREFGVLVPAGSNTNAAKYETEGHVYHVPNPNNRNHVCLVVTSPHGGVGISCP
jgi:hypothetical protein